jgi:hypothetical protein
MITNDQQLQVAQAAVQNLQRVLLAARKVHSPHEYRLMSAPVLIELQRREQDILDYLSRTEAEVVRGKATVARQHLTRRWSRPPTASARASLPLPTAAHRGR